MACGELTEAQYKRPKHFCDQSLDLLHLRDQLGRKKKAQIHSPRQLDLTTSVVMAKTAYVVYGRRVAPRAQKNWEKAHLTEVAEFTTRRVRCCVGHWRSGTRSSVVVAFRGSANSAEWANNAPLTQWEAVSPIIAGRVHPGFIHSLSEVWTELSKTIQQLSQALLPELLGSYASGRSMPLCFVGHSRGGALAVLAGLRALTTFKLPVGVYTFGALRVGDREFANTYNEIFDQGASVHWRFEGDPVPVFPFVLKARHTGSLVYLRKGSRTVQILGDERHVSRRGLRSVSTKGSQQHGMTAYLQYLGQAMAIETAPSLPSG